MFGKNARGGRKKRCAAVVNLFTRLYFREERLCIGFPGDFCVCRHAVRCSAAKQAALIHLHINNRTRRVDVYIYIRNLSHARELPSTRYTGTAYTLECTKGFSRLVGFCCFEGFLLSETR